MYDKVTYRFGLQRLLRSIEQSREDFEVLNRYRGSRGISFNRVRFLKEIEGSSRALFQSLSGEGNLSQSSRNITTNPTTCLERFLREGRLYDAQNAFFNAENDSSNEFSVRYLSQADRLLQAKENTLKATEELSCRLKAILCHIQSKSFKESLWRNSFELFNQNVVRLLIAILSDSTQFDAGNSSKDEFPPGEEHRSAVCYFQSYTNMLQKSFEESVSLNLIVARQESLQVLMNDFILLKHFEFVKAVFLLGKLDLYDNVREFIRLLAVHPGEDDQVFLKQQRAAQFNTLQLVIDALMQDIRPSHGIQHLSVYIPTVQETAALQTMPLNNPLEGEIIMNNLEGRREYDDILAKQRERKGVDELVLLQALSRLKVEVHYQWPLTLLFKSVSIERLHKLLRKLLALVCAKWMSECWWKAIIPRGGISGKIDDFINVGASSKEEIDRETDILRAKRTCQVGLIRVLRTVSILSRFILAKLHGELWKRFEEECLQIAISIEMVREGFESSLNAIEDLVSIVDEEMATLMKKIFKAFLEFRVALVEEQGGQRGNTLLIAFRMAEIAFDEALAANNELMDHLMHWNSKNNASFSSARSQEFARTVEELQAAFFM